MALVNGGDILVKQLKIAGVDFVFSIPGEPNTAIYAAMAAQAYSFLSRENRPLP